MNEKKKEITCKPQQVYIVMLDNYCEGCGDTCNCHDNYPGDAYVAFFDKDKAETEAKSWGGFIKEVEVRK
jgi:hypothetical protein